MDRKEVYNAIDEEREYQQKWDRERDDKSLPKRDETMAVEAWILWMEDYLQKARSAASTFVDKTEALHAIRKVVALGVACMEYNGAPRRE